MKISLVSPSFDQKEQNCFEQPQFCSSIAPMSQMWWNSRSEASVVPWRWTVYNWLWQLRSQQSEVVGGLCHRSRSPKSDDVNEMIIIRNRWTSAVKSVETNFATNTIFFLFIFYSSQGYIDWRYISIILMINVPGVPQKMFNSELFALLANEHFFWDTL